MMQPANVATLWSLLRTNTAPLVAGVVRHRPELAMIPPLMLAATASLGLVVERGAKPEMLQALTEACAVAEDIGDPWYAAPVGEQWMVVLVGRACARLLFENLGHEALAEQASRRLPSPGDMWLLGVTLLADGRAMVEELQEPTKTEPTGGATSLN